MRLEDLSHGRVNFRCKEVSSGLELLGECGNVDRRGGGSVSSRNVFRKMFGCFKFFVAVGTGVGRERGLQDLLKETNDVLKSRRIRSGREIS